jgi:hypothetical protein
VARQDTFTADEWALLRMAPTLVTGGMAAADPSGLIGSAREAAAGAQGMAEAYKAQSGLELFAALAADRTVPGTPDPALLGEGTVDQQLQNFKNAVLERVKAAVDLVTRKGSAAEAEAYKTMLVSVADKVANASMEGGFLGFGGVRVSDKERAFMAELKKAAGIS